MRIRGRTAVAVSSMLLLTLASKPAIADDGARPQLGTQLSVGATLMS